MLLFRFLFWKKQSNNVCHKKSLFSEPKENRNPTQGVPVGVRGKKGDFGPALLFMWRRISLMSNPFNLLWLFCVYWSVCFSFNVTRSLSWEMRVFDCIQSFSCLKNVVDIVRFRAHFYYRLQVYKFPKPVARSNHFKQFVETHHFNA